MFLHTFFYFLFGFVLLYIISFCTVFSPTICKFCDLQNVGRYDIM
nr:MAG TPA_asm: hypothetical protein [Inoviridae sp.]